MQTRYIYQLFENSKLMVVPRLELYGKKIIQYTPFVYTDKETSDTVWHLCHRDQSYTAKQSSAMDTESKIVGRDAYCSCLREMYICSLAAHTCLYCQNGICPCQPWGFWMVLSSLSAFGWITLYLVLKWNACQPLIKLCKLKCACTFVKPPWLQYLNTPVPSYCYRVGNRAVL